MKFERVATKRSPAALTVAILAAIIVLALVLVSGGTSRLGEALSCLSATPDSGGRC
jgi:hypothetical protein